jgi:hypothetical protein
MGTMASIATLKNIRAGSGKNQSVTRPRKDSVETTATRLPSGQKIRRR